MADFTLPELAERLDTVTNNMVTFTQQLRDWMAGTPTGGPNGDGKYPLSNGLTTILLECPAKMVSDTMKGDKGENARQDISFFLPNVSAPSELRAAFLVPNDTLFDPANSAARSHVDRSGAPESTYVLRKQGAPWGTITFAAGSQVGVVAIASPATVKGELIELLAPVSFDNTLVDVTITLAGE